MEKRLNIEIDAELLKALKRRAIDEGITLRQLVTQTLQDVVAGAGQDVSRGQGGGVLVEGEQVGKQDTAR